ncbi:MAG: lactonase family protein [Bacteroidota bacterium]
MKKLLLLVALVSPLFSIAQKKQQGPTTFNLIAGTFTGDGPTASKGIYVYRFYPYRVQHAYSNEVETKNPAFIAVTKDEKFIYAVNENSVGNSAVTAFTFDKKSGKMEQINSQPTTGSPCYITVDKARKNVIIANYGGGSLQVFPVNKDGSLGASTQTIKSEGNGPNSVRQEAPHIHSAVLSPDEKYLMVSDLGTDKINIYNYKASKTPALTPAATPFVSTAPGAGPRHSEFSPNGKFMYNVQELTATITAYAYGSGKLTEIETVKMMPENFNGVNGAADIHVTPDGLFLYATNRGSVNEIVAYAINQETGKLTFIERYPTGPVPRNFVIDPTGHHLLVGTTKVIHIYTRNMTNGRLVLTGDPIKVESAVCLKMFVLE